MSDQVVIVSILKETLADFRGEFKEILSVFRADLVRDIREETRSLIAASEKSVKTEILSGIAEIIDTAILPQIAEPDAILMRHKLKAA